MAGPGLWNYFVDGLTPDRQRVVGFRVACDELSYQEEHVRVLLEEQALAALKRDVPGAVDVKAEWRWVEVPDLSED